MHDTFFNVTSRQSYTFEKGLSNTFLQTWERFVHHILTYSRKVCLTQPADYLFLRVGQNMKTLRTSKSEKWIILSSSDTAISNIDKHNFFKFVVPFIPSSGEGIFREAWNSPKSTPRGIRVSKSLNFDFSENWVKLAEWILSWATLHKRCRTMFSKSNLISNPQISSTWRPVLPSSELTL